MAKPKIQLANSDLHHKGVRVLDTIKSLIDGKDFDGAAEVVQEWCSDKPKFKAIVEDVLGYVAVSFNDKALQRPITVISVKYW
jgi:hypothetical protein